MKKLILFLALMNGMSFSTMAISSSDCHEVPNSQTVAHNVKEHSSNNSKKVMLIDGECGWVTFSVSCGETFLGHIYACSIVDVLDAKISLQEQFCD